MISSQPLSGVSSTWTTQPQRTLPHAAESSVTITTRLSGVNKRRTSRTSSGLVIGLFSYWCNRRTGVSNKKFHRKGNHQHDRNHRVGWSNYSWNPPPYRNPIPSTGVSKNASRAGNNYAPHLGSPPNNC